MFDPAALKPKSVNTEEIRARYFPKEDISEDISSKEKLKRSLSFLILMLGALFYWISLPPLNFWPFVFLVPVVWSISIGQQKPPQYRWVYLSAFIFWIASIWWIACPHPLTSLGLLALAGWLSIYWPLFFLTSRVAVHRFKIPIVLAMPICWMGCEYLRYHLLSGFSFCALEHALYLKPRFIQIADIGGQYFVGAMIMLVGSGFAVPLLAVLNPVSSSTEKRKIPQGLWSGLFAVTVMIFVAWYGYGKIASWNISKTTPIRVATCQGNIPVRLDGDMEQAEKTFKQFIDLTLEAVQKSRDENKPIDLVVWPETVCPVPALVFQGKGKPEDIGLTEEQATQWKEQLFDFARLIDTPILYGLSTYVFEGGTTPNRLNSALLVDPKPGGDSASGPDDIGPRYDKVHLVMFGEYIPFSKYLPNDFFLKTLCQEAGRGTGPVAMPLGRQSTMAVNICFESSVPHLIRKQILTLKEQDKNPAVIVNISNDGWFRFSQQIDQHLATHIFRAVENRRYCVTATNGGFAAIIDNKGQIQNIGQRKAAEAVLGTVPVDFFQLKTPLYHKIGDWPAFLCMLLTIGFLIAQIIQNRCNRTNNPANERSTD